MRILFTGGGTGGHIYPLIAVLEALRKSAEKRAVEPEFYYMGAVGEYGETLINAGMDVRTIVGGKIRRSASPKNILDIPKFFIGFLQALMKLYFIMPDVIFSKGGTGALPVVLAGWFYRIPIVIHESDTVPGLTNLVSARMARRACVSFASALKYFTPEQRVHTGTPIREALVINQPQSHVAKQELGFDGAKQLILVWGGSQGSVRVNNLILVVLKELLMVAQVLHQTGQNNFSDVQKLSRAALMDVPMETAAKSRYEAVAYFEGTMRMALSAADLVISRGGSNSLAEIAVFGKPAIVIPLPESAGDHQRSNAYEFAKGGGGIVIEEPNLLPEIFMSQVKEVLGNPERAEAMRRASKAFFKPNAAELVAEEILGAVAPR
jgi:UDP-N-acetylglucosamine--N-acetylmuramyl-(pentapeptide) pyrophosphoryl-undecaprenol N-acetylglucosamine transferase